MLQSQIRQLIEQLTNSGLGRFLSQNPVARGTGTETGKGTGKGGTGKGGTGKGGTGKGGTGKGGTGKGGTGKGKGKGKGKGTGGTGRRR